MFGRWRRKRKDKEAVDEKAEHVNEQVSDSVTEDALHTIANSAALSIDQAIFAQSQAHATLFASMVRDQRRMTDESQLEVLRYTADIFGISPDALLKPSAKKKQQAKDRSHG